VDCLLTAEWKSPNKIIARTGQAKGKGDIIVVTKSGGVGTCTVNYRGYNVQIGKKHVTFVCTYICVCVCVCVCAHVCLTYLMSQFIFSLIHVYFCLLYIGTTD